MDYNNFKSIKDYGFEGYIPVTELMQNHSIVPHNKGVYMVLYTPDDSPEFLTEGTGGYFKRKNPNVPVEKLNESWIKNTKVIYIGKAGGGKSSATLNSRIKQLLKFGSGKNASHYGGRVIWQIEDINHLIVCWKELTVEDPNDVKNQLIKGFKKIHRKRPFANMVD
ncbi:hypothetical protein [Ferdinandcohnia sp. SAFN-114]|uniref:hypothetical protein n=1 Tax=Ferdinandcohnia sp. SAFN-114 TaxID=3387275 RepID=UPI003F8079CF